jgi:hypothetical protein
MDYFFVFSVHLGEKKNLQYEKKNIAKLSNHTF